MNMGGMKSQPVENKPKVQRIASPDPVDTAAKSTIAGKKIASQNANQLTGGDTFGGGM